MYLLIVFLSLIGSCLAGLFGRYLGPWGSAIISTGCVFLSLLLSIFTFYHLLHVDWDLKSANKTLNKK